MGEDAELGPAVSNRLAYQLKAAQLRLHALHDDLLAPFGLTAGQLAILLLIDARAPESQQQMAQRLGIDRTTMVSLIDALETAGLVERQPDPADRRRNVIGLTTAGGTTLRRARKASDKAEQRLLAGLDATEAAQLRHLLARVVAGGGHGRGKRHPSD